MNQNFFTKKRHCFCLEWTRPLFVFFLFSYNVSASLTSELLDTFSLDEAVEMGMKLETRYSDRNELIYFSFDEFSLCEINNPVVHLLDANTSFAAYLAKEPFGRYKIQVSRSSNLQLLVTFGCDEKRGRYRITFKEFMKSN